MAVTHEGGTIRDAAAAGEGDALIHKVLLHMSVSREGGKKGEETHDIGKVRDAVQDSGSGERTRRRWTAQRGRGTCA